MATLISSKQIQGVVTASVIQGDFSVGGGGSVNLSAASGVTGSFTGSFIGDGSGIVNIPYTSIVSLPTLVSGSSQIDITQTDGFTSLSVNIVNKLEKMGNLARYDWGDKLTNVEGTGTREVGTIKM